MERDPTTFDRSSDGPSENHKVDDGSKLVPSQSLSEMTSKSGLGDQPASSPPNAAANPEFAKWWRRWASRVRRISVRKKPPARRVKMEPPNSDLRSARLVSAECEFE